MALRKQTQVFIVSLVIVLLTGVGLFLYDNFFKKLSYQEAIIPPADIYRISPPTDLPDFAITDYQGRKVNISQFKGKNLLINFWATWCQPCIKELPQLDNLVEVIGKENIEIITISIDQAVSLSSLQNFFYDLKIANLAIYQDTELEAYEELQSMGIPTTILVDKNLKAHVKISGYLNWEDPQVMNIINQIPN